MKMNLQFLLFALLSLGLGACSSTYHTGSTTPDDVYYSSRDQAPANNYPATAPASANDYSSPSNDYSQNSNQNTGYNDAGYSSSQYQDGNGNTYVTNNYYNDDYYDYSYSSRLRRFYTPVYGYSYYDPYYTNSYWYDYRPASWGVSIYLGYNWWAPASFYYSPFCYGGYSIGIGYGAYYSPWYSPWYYSSWYRPHYYGYGFHNSYYHGYMSGYNHGFYDGYYGSGYNPYYYNSYDPTSTYYGPRGSGSDNSPRPAGRQNSSSPMTLSDKYQTAVQEGRVTAKPVNTGSTPNNLAAPAGRDKSNTQSSDPVNIAQPGKGATRDITNTPSRQTQPSTPEQSGKTQESTPSRGIISDKNLNGTQPDSRNQSGPGFAKPEPSRDNSAPVREPVSEPSRSTSPRDIQGTTPATRPETPRNPGRDMQPSQPSRTPQQEPQRQKENDSPRLNYYTPAPSPRMEQSPSRSTAPAQRSQDNDRQPQRNVVPQPDYTAPKQQDKPRKLESFFKPQQEQRTPMVQPRNEPRQYKQENNVSPQRSTPSISPAPAPSQPAPRQSEPSRSNGPRRN